MTYANRPQGATTGAWPGYQPFGGWKGSGSTGKAIASFYYLAQYLREQSRTVVEHVTAQVLVARARRSQRHVRDGDCVALEGFTHLIPFAAGHEIIRQEPPQPAPGAHDARPRLRPDDRHGLREPAHVLLGRQPGRRLAAPPARCGRARAGPRRSRSTSTRTPAWPPPTAPARRGCRSACCAATSAPTCRRSTRAIRSVECPFTGERLAAVPAINPDVTILHAQRADRQGNVALHGIVGAQREAALAARALLVTVEEIVEALPPAMNCDRAAALGGERGGASARAARIRRTRRATTRATTRFYQRWDAIARDRDGFRAWMERHVLGSRDHAAFLASLRGARHERLDARRDDDRGRGAAAVGRLRLLRRHRAAERGLQSRAAHARARHRADLRVRHASARAPTCCRSRSATASWPRRRACVVPLPEIFSY